MMDKKIPSTQNVIRRKNIRIMIRCMTDDETLTCQGLPYYPSVQAALAIHGFAIRSSFKSNFSET
jgi:hypothetical protein